MISMIWMGLAVGCPIFGKLSDKIQRRKPLLYFCTLLGICSSVYVIWTPSHNMWLLTCGFFLIGFAGSGQNLAFALMSEQAPTNLRGTALALNNTAIMGFAAIIPPCITKVMAYFAENGIYTVESFEKGLMVIPICFAIAFFILIFSIRETYCRQQSVLHKL